ncbi:MAG: CapA family protein [Clostridia bacterium]|nr:CapA family protein [Clostridia bacterium]
MRRNQRKNNKIKSEKKESKIILTIFIIVLFIITIYTLKNVSLLINETKISKNNNNQIIIEKAESENIIQNEIIIEEKPITFTLTSLGDTLCHNTQYWDAYNSATKQYDFSYVYEDIINYTSSSDLTIGSLETSFAGEDRGYSNYPTFNSPDSLATALKNIGVDIISTAGNHALDYGYSGLCRTIDVLEKNEISHLGTYKTLEEQEKVLIKNVKGVNIAFINYTYGTNGIPVPKDKPYCINLIDRDLIKKQIKIAKDKNVDMIVACMHWGIEYLTTASLEQEELADFLFQNGVDVILGNHPHVLQPMQKRNITLDDGTEKEVFVVYSLGNLTADQREEITKDSAILNLTITKQTDGKITIDKVDYVPIYMYKNFNSIKKFKILDIEKTILDYENGLNISISSTLYNNLKVQLEKIKSILGDEI